MKKVLTTLAQPYPYYNNTGKLVKNAVVIFLSVCLFLYFFRPFNVNEAEHKYDYLFICILHALNAAIVYLVFFLLFNKFVGTTAREDNWKVYHAIGTTSIVFFLIGLGSFLLRPLIYTNPDNFSWHYFISETINTFLAGTLVFAGFTLADYYRLLKANRDSVTGFRQQLKSNQQPPVAQEATTGENNPVTIIAENEPVKLDPAEFLFAKSEGNYVSFYFNKNGNITRDLKRISLKNMEEQLAGHPSFLIRTHRAFLVNPTLVVQMTGNAQGYQLYFHLVDFPVPVSRAMIPAFKRVMEAK